jgi:Ca2+-binding EF-hand superfamily protein
MKNKSTSQNKSKSRSLTRTPSSGLVEYLDQKYQKSIPISAITAAQKLYGKAKPLTKDDKFIKRFANGKDTVDATKLLEYLGKNEVHEKGKPLSAEAVGRVYQNFSNHDGKLSFEFVMKMGESSGVAISEKMAKAIVRKYGKRKDYLDLEDCVRINDRWTTRNTSKSPNKGLKK